MMRMATKWYAVPGHRRFAPDDDRRATRSRASRQRGTGGNEDAGQPVHPAAGSNPDPADARRCRRRPAAAPSRERTGAPSPRSTCTGPRRPRHSGERRPTSSRGRAQGHVPRRSAQTRRVARRECPRTFLRSQARGDRSNPGWPRPRGACCSSVCCRVLVASPGLPRSGSTRAFAPRATVCRSACG